MKRIFTSLFFAALMSIAALSQKTDDRTAAHAGQSYPPLDPRNLGVVYDVAGDELIFNKTCFAILYPNEIGRGSAILALLTRSSLSKK